MKKSTGKDSFKSPLYSNGTSEMSIKRPVTDTVEGPKGGKSSPDPLGILGKHN